MNAAIAASLNTLFSDIVACLRHVFLANWNRAIEGWRVLRR